MIEVIARPADERRTRIPLLFVHGPWHGAWCWDRGYLDFFAARGWDSFALSLRAHGNSPGHGGLRWIGHDRFIEDIEHVADSLEAAPVLIGHSMGAYLVQKYLESNYVSAAALLAPVPPGGILAAAARFASRHPVQFLKALTTLRMWPVVQTPDLAREMLFGSDLPDETITAMHAMLQDESFRSFLDMALLARPQPERTEAPVLVVAGGADRLFTVREAEKTAEAYGVEARIVDGLPHDLMLHPEWEAGARVISRWLEDVT